MSGCFYSFTFLYQEKEWFKITEISFYHKKLENEDKIKHKVRIRRGIINIRAEINEAQNSIKY